MRLGRMRNENPSKSSCEMEQQVNLFWCKNILTSMHTRGLQKDLENAYYQKLCMDFKFWGIKINTLYFHFP